MIGKFKLTICLASLLLAFSFLEFAHADVQFKGTKALSQNVTDSLDEETRALASQWALAVKKHDGKAQYTLMAKDLQNTVYSKFSEQNWVIETPIPLFDFSIRKNDAGATVIFYFVYPLGPGGCYQQNLTFTRENGTLKISRISEPEKFETWGTWPLLTGSLHHGRGAKTTVE